MGVITCAIFFQKITYILRVFVKSCWYHLCCESESNIDLSRINNRAKFFYSILHRYDLFTRRLCRSDGPIFFAHFRRNFRWEKNESIHCHHPHHHRDGMCDLAADMT